MRCDVFISNLRSCTGVGARGTGIVSRLMESSSIEREHAWYVDAEERSMDLAMAPNRLQLSYEVSTPYCLAELQVTIEKSYKSSHHSIA